MGNEAAEKEPPDHLCEPGTRLKVSNIGVHGWDGTDDGCGFFEDEGQLINLMGKFGRCVRASVRHRIQDGHNISWAIVTFETPDGANRALAAVSIMAGTAQLVVTPWVPEHYVANGGGGITYDASTVRDGDTNLSEAAAAALAFPHWYEPTGNAIQVADKIFEYLECSSNIRALEVFFTVDTDGSGEVDEWEWEEALRKMRISLPHDMAKAVFETMDNDNGGTISIEEFMTQMRQAKKWRKAANAQALKAQTRTDEQRQHIQEQLRELSEHKAVVDIFQHPGNTINLSRGDLVFKKGAAADCMFFIRSGGVAFYHNTDDVDLDESMEHALSTLTAGDFFGEAALLTSGSRALAAVAKGDTTLLRLPRSELEDILPLHKDLQKQMRALQNSVEVEAAEEALYLKKVECLDGEERAAAIEDAGTSAWDRAQMTAAMGGAPGAEEAVDSSDEERLAWQKEEMEAQLAELAAAKEEEEAQAAEANYSKEEQEAKEAEEVAAREEEEARQALENAEREEAEADAAVLEAEKEEAEAKEAEERAAIEVEEAEAARVNAEKEEAEALAAIEEVKKERQEVRVAVAELMMARKLRDTLLQRLGVTPKAPSDKLPVETVEAVTEPPEAAEAEPEAAPEAEPEAAPEAALEAAPEAATEAATEAEPEVAGEAEAPITEEDITAFKDEMQGQEVEAAAIKIQAIQRGNQQRKGTDGLAQLLERAEQRVKQKNLALLLSESRADAAERIAEKEMQEANEAKATAAKEKQDAVEAVAAAKKERGEAVEARATALKEKQEAQEAREIAEREILEFEEAKADAERERAEAQEAKDIAERERAEANEAKEIAIRERAEADAAKEVYMAKLAEKQAAELRAKQRAKKKAKKKKNGDSEKNRRSVLHEMLGQLPDDLVRFDGECRVEAEVLMNGECGGFGGGPLPEAAIGRAERLQFLRQEYSAAVHAATTSGLLPAAHGAAPAGGHTRGGHGGNYQQRRARRVMQPELVHRRHGNDGSNTPLSSMWREPVPPSAVRTARSQMVHAYGSASARLPSPGRTRHKQRHLQGSASARRHSGKAGGGRGGKSMGRGGATTTATDVVDSARREVLAAAEMAVPASHPPAALFRQALLLNAYERAEIARLEQEARHAYGAEPNASASASEVAEPASAVSNDVFV